MICILGALLAVHPLATVNAVLNAVATVLLIAGWLAIRAGSWRLHRAAMLAAFTVSAIFLICYLTYHALVGHVPFAGQGGVRGVYFVILISHILLAAAVPLLALTMLWLAFRRRWAAHVRLGRITMPIWLYVSITGVVIYLMLYHLYPGDREDPTLQSAGMSARRVFADCSKSSPQPKTEPGSAWRYAVASI
jgi:uncharacterized membrane protein YozB (DUF420 family)